MHVEVQSPTPVQLADVLLAVRLSRSSDDRYVHVSSIIKALRWGVRHLGLDCFQCAHSAIGGRLLHTKIPKDVMSGRVYHSLSSRSSDGNERFLLGTFPRFWRSSWGAFFSSLDWADLQRVSPSSLVFDFQDIRDPWISLEDQNDYEGTSFWLRRSWLHVSFNTHLAFGLAPTFGRSVQRGRPCIG